MLEVYLNATGPVHKDFAHGARRRLPDRIQEIVHFHQTDILQACLRVIASACGKECEEYASSTSTIHDAKPMQIHIQI